MRRLVDLGDSVDVKAMRKMTGRTPWDAEGEDVQEGDLDAVMLNRF